MIEDGEGDSERESERDSAGSDLPRTDPQGRSFPSLPPPAISL
jgi:hypothetical protein